MHDTKYMAYDGSNKAHSILVAIPMHVPIKEIFVVMPNQTGDSGIEDQVWRIRNQVIRRCG
mgnify:CR=1 FL=1